MKDLFKENYKAVVNRGLITEKIGDVDFINKLLEESFEVFDEAHSLDFKMERLNEELADVITVCANWIIHNGGDPVEELQKVLEKNKKRSNFAK